jgi:antitoxin component YwqK of YwqJK toxin-antitoxin module
MSKLIDYKSPEAEILKPIFQEKMIDPFIAHVVESFIYKEVIDCNKDGIIVEKYMLKYGNYEGLYQSWHPDGKKFIECNYKEGKKEGLSQWWYENGQKWFEYNYKEDKFDGEIKEWNNPITATPHTPINPYTNPYPTYPQIWYTTSNSDKDTLITGIYNITTKA